MRDELARPPVGDDANEESPAAAARACRMVVFSLSQSQQAIAACSKRKRHPIKGKRDILQSKMSDESFAALKMHRTQQKAESRERRSAEKVRHAGSNLCHVGSFPSSHSQTFYVAR
jgi:hypothetical protein